MTWFTKKWDPLSDPRQPRNWRKRCVARIDGNADLDECFEATVRMVARAAISNRHTYVYATSNPGAVADHFRDMYETDNLDEEIERQSYEDAVLKSKPSEWKFSHVVDDSGWPIVNFIPAALVADQAEADARIPLLLPIPAKYRIVLAEGMRGPVNLIDIACEMIDVTSMSDDRRRFAPAFNRGIHGLIVSGDTDPMHPAWVRSLRDQCDAAGVAFRFEGWGDWHSGGDGLSNALWNDLPQRAVCEGGGSFEYVKQYGAHVNDGRCRHDHLNMYCVGRRHSGRLLDGRTHDATPWDKEDGR
jgi:hypothetical protein